MNTTPKFTSYTTVQEWREAAIARGLEIIQDVEEGDVESGPCEPSGRLIAVGADDKEYGYFDLFETESGIVFEDHEDYFAYIGL